VKAFGFEVEAQPLGQVVLVFDNQDALRHSDCVRRMPELPGAAA
jgi:hypothetical protein